jgi:hypothetical protein
MQQTFAIQLKFRFSMVVATAAQTAVMALLLIGRPPIP